MSRKDDLERQIRESYEIIRQYEEIVQASDRPEEVQRAERKIEEQWGRIREPLVQYLALCQRRNLATPEDIVEIAVTFGPELDEAVAAYRPPLLPLPSRHGWMVYGAIALTVLAVGAIIASLLRGTEPAATTPAVTQALTPIPPTKTATSTASPTPSPTPSPSPTPLPTHTPTMTPTLGQGTTYRVAIAEFYTEVPDPVEVALWIESDLRATMKAYGLIDNVDLDVISEPVKLEGEAQELASATDSDVLIWGWYDSIGVHLHVLLERDLAESPATDIQALRFDGADQSSDISFYVTDVMPSNTTFISMFVIGHLYYLSNNYAEGHRAFDAAMENIPEEVALENEALVHFFNARLMETTTYTDATEIVCEYARAIELDPNFFEAYNNLGALMLNLYPGYNAYSFPNPYEQEPCLQAAGISSLSPPHLFDRVLQIRPDWALAHYNLAVLWWNGADIYVGRESRDQSCAKFKHVLELDPTIAGAHIALGNMDVWDQDFDTAAERFATAFELWPESPEVAASLGQALALAGRDEEALAAYQQALVLAPDNAEIRLMLGNFYHRLGDLSLAHGEYQQAQQYADKHLAAVLSLELAKYEIDTGMWLSATQRLESPELDYNLLAMYLRWLVGTIQGNPEAAQYHLPEGWLCDDKYVFAHWVWGATDNLALCNLIKRCGTLETWGSEPTPCLPTDLEERLETIYTQFQLSMHYRLFFNQMILGQVGACPHVFTYDEQRHGWFPDTTIIYKLIGPQAEQLQARPLTRFDGRLWLRELESEISYVDQLCVRILTADGRWLTLTPDDPALTANDGDYLILQQGDERMLEFELPPGTLPAQRAWVVADGYYVPHDARE